jgi:hypothetical protein
MVAAGAQVAGEVVVAGSGAGRRAATVEAGGVLTGRWGVGRRGSSGGGSGRGETSSDGEARRRRRGGVAAGRRHGWRGKRRAR